MFKIFSKLPIHKYSSDIFSLRFQTEILLQNDFRKLVISLLYLLIGSIRKILDYTSIVVYYLRSPNTSNYNRCIFVRNLWISLAISLQMKIFISMIKAC